MIVKDEGTLIQAMDFITVGPVYYSDHSRFGVIEDPGELEALLRSQLDKDDIAIVVLKSHKGVMEDYGWSLRMVKKERRMAEQRAIRGWVTTHPEQARKIQERMAKRESSQ